MKPENERALIRNIRLALSGSDPSQHVDLIETHISWVLLTGDVAFKIKKPVHFDFIDCSTLERRKHFCEEEIRLNGRLAPNVYLDTVPITGSITHPVVNGTGEAIEYAVRMKKFSQSQLVKNLLSEGNISRRHIDQLAQHIAQFHRDIDSAPADTTLGRPAHVWQPVQETLEALSNLSMAIDTDRLRDLDTWISREFSHRELSIAKRHANGFIRECHGDMHAGNMALIDDQIVVFDGIEFNDDLMWIDVMSEVAFTVMDFEYRGCREFSRRYLNQYLQHSGDYDGLSLLPFYVVYRALVRAKVAGLTAMQSHDPSKNEAAVTKCSAHLNVAHRWTQRGATSLIITHGLSGSGKSFWSELVVELTGSIRIRSDVERKRLAAAEPMQTSGNVPSHDDESTQHRLYSDSMNLRTYDRLAVLAVSILRAGLPVIVDATFLKRQYRQCFYKLALHAGVRFCVLDFQASTAELVRRIQIRETLDDDASDASTDVLNHQLLTADPFTDDELDHVIAINTEHEAEAAELLTAGLHDLCEPTDFRRP